MCACVGIEVLAALGDVCGLEAKGVEEVALGGRRLRSLGPASAKVPTG